MTAASKQTVTDLKRDARRLLTQLGETGARLRGAHGRFVLPPHQNNRTEEAPRALVEFCLGQDWLERRGEDLLLSHAGAAYLRRCEAGDDAFRQQHQLRSMREKDVEGTRRPVLSNETESPLGWLRNRKDRNGRPLISEHQFEAGERLRADHWLAHLSPRVTANWSAVVPSKRARRSAPCNASAFTDNAMAAKQRVMHALAAVGSELASVLIDVCCELKGLEEAERANGWPQRAGKVVLQIALTRLAKHYGLLAPEASSRNATRRLRHWGTADYRPTLNAWHEADDQ